MFASYMINGWIVATIIAVVAGAVGVFVVLRGTSFAAHALPIGAFPGAAAADLFGIHEIWGLLIFAMLGVLGITQLGRRQRRDVATALTLVTLLGLGTLFLSLSGHYAQGVFALLFGQLVSVSRGDILPVAGIGLLVLGTLAARFRPLLLSSASPDLAAARGWAPAQLDLLFLGLVGLTTAMALPVVGALLVFSLMVGPAAAARSFARRPAQAVALSIAFSLGTLWAAIALAYVTDWPIGFFVGSIAAALFTLSEVPRRFSRTALG
ncbi:MAG TPA: metal ABC transporter permease [Acidisoma sp.]|uniref:metal ABC transporter permease n=1 Tax=Acidisoma sp. TaxID=1872115 RepID=UPI002D0CB22F|nr:metal ABC transporter permease [Acidisoma sp.]HTI02123.1 metal ABC transporter permease [Acidisoma sp.]